MASQEQILKKETKTVRAYVRHLDIFQNETHVTVWTLIRKDYGDQIDVTTKRGSVVLSSYWMAVANPRTLEALVKANIALPTS